MPSAKRANRSFAAKPAKAWWVAVIDIIPSSAWELILELEASGCIDDRNGVLNNWIRQGRAKMPKKVNDKQRQAILQCLPRARSRNHCYRRGSEGRGIYLLDLGDDLPPTILALPRRWLKIGTHELKSAQDEMLTILGLVEIGDWIGLCQSVVCCRQRERQGVFFFQAGWRSRHFDEHRAKPGAETSRAIVLKCQKPRYQVREFVLHQFGRVRFVQAATTRKATILLPSALFS